MASLLFGIDSGLIASVDLGSHTTSEDISDIPEAIVPSNMVIGLTQEQMNNLFDVSAESGILEVSAAAVQNLIAAVINDDTAGGLFTTVTSGLPAGVTLNSGEPVIGTDTNNAVYNMSKVVSALRTYLHPDTYVQDFKDSFIATSLGVSVATLKNYPNVTDIRSKYDALGFFGAFQSSIDSADVLGTDTLATGADVTLDTAGFQAEALFMAIADAGFVHSAGSETGISAESGFAIAMELSVTGSTSIALTYSADSVFTGDGGNTIANTLTGALFSGTVRTTETYTAGDADVRGLVQNPSGGGSTSNTVTTKVLLYRI